MTYNVQNLFDAELLGSEYAEYREGWSPELYRLKLKVVAEAIRSSPRVPDLISLQEIENRRVLEDLQTELKDQGYLFIAQAVQGATGVGVLSRLPMRRTRIHQTGKWEGGALRPILEVECVYRDRILYVFNVHFKSKSFSVERTEAARRIEVEVLRRRILEIMEQNPDADIVVSGDLNENVDEYAQIGQRYPTALVPVAADPGQSARYCLSLSPVPMRWKLPTERVILYEPWYELSVEQRGCYFYSGDWQTPDHLLLSPGLFDQKGFSYTPGGFTVVDSKSLLDESGHPQAFIWRTSGVTARGCSDHLPLIISLTIAAKN